MRRRDFIKGIAGSASVWPLASRAQQSERMRRIGVLFTGSADDQYGQVRNATFLQALQGFGWTVGRNVRIDTRWGGADADRIRRNVAELVATGPDVILATGSANLGPLLQASRSIPVVFAVVPDPVGAGYVDSLARPGGNATGFMLYEYGISGKWPGLLKQIAPGVTRVAVLRDPGITAGIGQFAAIQTSAPSLGMEIVPINVRETKEIESIITTFARVANGGLIVTGSPSALLHSALIIALAAQHKLPAIYFEREFVAAGGLISYGPDLIDQYRLAAGYVDRVLKGEKPSEMPVQAPNKYELVINLKTAKNLGLSVPPELIASANEVIE